MLTCVSIGKIMATNGWSLTVNANFAQQATFLAQQLTCSKTCIASLHVIMSRHPNISLVSSVKVIIVEFHQQRRHLVNCLHSPPRTTVSNKTVPITNPNTALQPHVGISLSFGVTKLSTNPWLQAGPWVM